MKFKAANVRRGSVILAFVLLSSGLFASARVDQDVRQSFPLSPGTSWVYRGFVRWRDGRSTVGTATSVTWTMSVVRLVERDGVSAVVVKGFPGDLDWSAGHAEPQLSMLIRTDDAKFYLNSEWSTQSVLDQLDNPKYPLRELEDVDSWILQLPLAQGMKFCDEVSRQRADGRYCWLTGAPHPAVLNRVKGLAPGTRTAYEVAYDSNPDDTEFEFVDGVGITSYGYHHHGSVADTEVHLVEFHPGDSVGR
jgi:hypothetical protein